MSIASEPKRCPKCGGPIPAEAPQGLCPTCLLLEVSAPTEAGQGAPAKSAPPAQAELAAAFPQLEILELIGQGGMGYVFKARQPKLDRFVALKILPHSLAADAAFAERFTREGRLLARLNHPNIVTIHDFGQANGFFYLLMEFVDGVNLRQAMKAGRFTPGQALAVVPKICEALQYAHNEGILHRDIKPENILLDTKGRVKIADFGIAKLVGETRAEAKSSAGGGPPPEASLTESGSALGTPNYMAPEQVERPGDVDHRADIYSLGVVFYEMLTGELPLGRFAPPSEKSPMDARLDDVVLRALEKEPSRRTQTAGEVKTQVEAITASAQPPPSHANKMDAAATAVVRPSASKPFRPRWLTVCAWSSLAMVLALIGLLAPNFIRSGQNSECVIEPVAVVRENSPPGMTVFRWKCSVPAGHALIFNLVSWSSNSIPSVLEDLSSFYIAGAGKRREIICEWTLQDGAMLSPELREQQRWNKSVIDGGSRVDFSPVWTRKDKFQNSSTVGFGEGQRFRILPGRMQSVPMLFRGTNPSASPAPDTRLLEAQVTLHAVPKELPLGSMSVIDQGTNWLAAARRFGRRMAADSTSASHQSAPPGKTVVLTGATNELRDATNGVRTVSVKTDSTVLAGETLLARVKLPDGRMEDANTHLSVNSRAKANDVGTTSWFSWFFRDSFGAEEAEAAVSQIRQTKSERPFVLIPGELFELFSVTNKVGGVVVGYLEFNRSEPKPLDVAARPGAKVEATVRIHRYTAYMPSLEYSVSLPNGYALRATADAGQASTSVSLSSKTASYYTTWFQQSSFMSARDPGKTRESQQSALEQQFRQLQEQGPITVVLGQPQLVFAVTNGFGEVYRGFFELAGPPAPQALTSAVRPPARVQPGKVVVLTGATNELIGDAKQFRIVRVHTDSTLFPGETLLGVTKLPDGRMGGGTTSFSIQRGLNNVQTSSYFSWAFPDSFAPEDFEAAAAQLRQNKTERPIELHPDEPFDLFSVTNKYGGILSGYLQFNRVVPEDSAGASGKVHASIRLRPYDSGSLLAFYSADVPPGYFLEATANWAELGEGQASTSMGGPDSHSSWSPPGTFSYEQTRAASAQFRQLAEEGAFQVFLGEPRLVLSITNKTGEVFRGFFELVGPPSAANK